MHLVLGEKALALIAQQREAPTVPSTKIQRGTDALYPIGQRSVGALSELGKSVDLPLDGKKMSRESQARLSEKKIGNYGIFKCNRMPPKV